MNPKRRFVMGIVLVLATVWLVAWGGYRFAESRRVTAEKVMAYLRDIDLSKLSPAERAGVLRELAKKLNALSMDDRRRARMDEEWRRWFKAMTEEEKGEFIEATLPTGIKQMLTAFEELPEEKRKRAIDVTLKRLEEARKQAGDAPPEGPLISEAVRDKAIKTGLRTYFTQSSAQMKVELAPILEELQRVMERGHIILRGEGMHP